MSSKRKQARSKANPPHSAGSRSARDGVPPASRGPGSIQAERGAAASIPDRGRRGWGRQAQVLAVSALTLLAGGGWVLADWWLCLPDEARATYVGSQSCIECHRDYYDLWKGSMHDLAMDPATPETVLGDFDDAEFDHLGVKSRMFRRDGKYFAHTEGPDGKLADFEVKYVFGVDPLQNYLVEFDRAADQPATEVARLQVLRVAWDTHRRRWFYCAPPDVRGQLAPDDDLHWTGIAQRWNNMCADCHSTNLQKNFDDQAVQYHTTFSEIDVSCESCHGPGSLHVELSRSRGLFWDRKRGYGLPRLKASAQTQIHTCAPCHSRRRVVQPGLPPGENYYDGYANELLQRETYFPDGQILDEDYVYASFIQSKMYHKGIRCSDCHDPHSTRLKQPGNQVCTSCHQHPAGKYDGPAHHFHPPGTTGTLCVECHMPETTYMEVDPRRDHSIRIPRPDLSLALGVPNACTRCHLDTQQPDLKDRPDLRQYLDWVLAARRGDAVVQAELARVDAEMEQACREWYGDKSKEPGRRQHFAHALAAAHRGETAAEPDLIRVVDDARLPAVVRATALFELGQFGTAASMRAARRALDDPDPQVRAVAVDNLPGRLPNAELARVLAPVLNDPIRLVRTEAARTLAALSDQLRGTEREQWQGALDEFFRGLASVNDRAGSHLTRALVYEGLGQYESAIQAYRTAIRVEPAVSGPRTNLAALYERLAEAADQQAQQAMLLRDPRTLAAAREQADEYRRQIRQLRREELVFLGRDADLLPDGAIVQYRYGMALYLDRQFDKAEQALVRAAELEPNDPQFLLGVVLFYKERRQPEKSLPLAERLVALRPQDPMYRHVLAELRQEAARPQEQPAPSP